MRALITKVSKKLGFSYLTPRLLVDYLCYLISQIRRKLALEAGSKDNRFTRNNFKHPIQWNAPNISAQFAFLSR